MNVHKGPQNHRVKQEMVGGGTNMPTVLSLFMCSHVHFDLRSFAGSLTQLFTHTSMHSFLVFPFGCSPGHSAWIPLITTNNYTSINIAHLPCCFYHILLSPPPATSPMLTCGWHGICMGYPSFLSLPLPLSALGWHVMVALVLFSSSPLLY